MLTVSAIGFKGDVLLGHLFTSGYGQWAMEQWVTGVCMMVKPSDDRW